jgi:hypothetical protein
LWSIALSSTGTGLLTLVGLWLSRQSPPIAVALLEWLHIERCTDADSYRHERVARAALNMNHVIVLG